MFRKVTDLGKDPYLALLEYRNFPVTGMKYSPAQILISQHPDTKIPVATSLLSPTVVDPSRDLMRSQHDKSIITIVVVPNHYLPCREGMWFVIGNTMHGRNLMLSNIVLMRLVHT